MSSYNVSEANVSTLEECLAVIAGDDELVNAERDTLQALFKISVTVNALRLAGIQQLMADNAEHSERQRQRHLDILANARQKFDNEKAVQLSEHTRKERELLERVETCKDNARRMATEYEATKQHVRELLAQIERLTASDDSETEDLIAFMSDGIKPLTESEN